MGGNRRRPWRVRVTTGWELDEKNGKAKQISKTLGYYSTRKEAVLALAEFNAKPYDISNRHMTFSQAYEKWSLKHYEKYAGAARSLKSVYKHCKPLYDINMIDIRTAHMQAIMDTLSSCSITYQTKLKTIFNKTFSYCLKNDVVQKDYAQFVTINQTAPKQDIKNKFFTEQQIKTILDNKDWIIRFPTGMKSYADIKMVDTIIILLYTGLRIGELLKLKAADVDIANRVIQVHGTKTAAAERLVPIHKELLPYIKHRLDNSNEYLISNDNGKPISGSAYRMFFFEPFMKYLGLSLTPHATRHTFISIMDRCGIGSDSVMLKRIVGHADKTVTEHYTHKDLPDLIAAIDRFALFSKLDNHG